MSEGFLDGVSLVEGVVGQIKARGGDEASLSTHSSWTCYLNYLFS
jgi:hypothetical protein